MLICFNNNLKKITKHIITFSLLIFTTSFGKAEIPFISNKLYPSIINKDFNEINVINFIGASQNYQNELANYVTSKATVNNLPYKFFSSFYYEFERNPSMSNFIQNEFRKGLINLRENVPFFDKTTVDNDLISIRNFYQLNGFHDAKVTFRFYPSINSRENILDFVISEGQRYKIKEVNYIGLDNIAEELKGIIVEFKNIKLNTYFNEPFIQNSLNNLTSFLKNNGYYEASYSTPLVKIDTSQKEDYITINFTLGNRYRIGRIDFIDSANNQPLIANDMKLRQLAFDKGDWYSYQKIDQTKDNFLSLGLFEIVAIDTTSRFQHQNDSTLNFVIFLSYRKQQEYGVGFSFNQTRMDNLVNVGVEANYRHRNIFNAAQEFSPFANLYAKDILSTITTGSLELETQVGFKFTQPLLWTIDNSRISLLTSFSYSLRSLNNFFTISTINFPVTFAIRFPRITYFNRGSIDFQFLRENPINFDEALSEAISSAKNEQDINNILQAFLLYEDLSKYLNEKDFHLLTSNIIGVSLTGDTRNNPFSPSNGYFTFFGADGWNPLFYPKEVSGLARYIRLQLTHYQFFKLTPTTTLALKGRFGGIQLLEDGNSYVPIDRQFFCGGANSVRAWPSRQLRYSNFTSDSVDNKNTFLFLQNFIGNGVLIEGSIEFRFGFPKPPGLNLFLQNLVQNIKTTLFLDFGNAFHWFLSNEDLEVKPLDYITKLAVGAGIGLRYETPIGPLRVDFAVPVYDPLYIKKPFRSVTFNFGLGHAF